jgi:hypothetical protein
MAGTEWVRFSRAVDYEIYVLRKRSVALLAEVLPLSGEFSPSSSDG